LFAPIVNPPAVATPAVAQMLAPAPPVAAVATPAPAPVINVENPCQKPSTCTSYTNSWFILIVL